MKENPGLHRGYRSKSSSSTAIVPPRRYSIERLNDLGRRFSGALDIGKFNHAAIQAGVLKRQIVLPYVTFMDGPLAELPTNYRHGLATVSTEMRRQADDWVLLQDSTHPQASNSQPVATNSSLAKQDEGFAKFLRRHSSPTHQRVTAGGRIVPMEATPPPQLKPFIKCSGADDPVKKNPKIPFSGQHVQLNQGSTRGDLGGSTREHFQRSGTVVPNGLPFSPSSSGTDNNPYVVNNPRLGSAHTTSAFSDSMPWWVPYNHQQRGFGGMPVISSVPQVNTYRMPLYPPNSTESTNGPPLMNFPPGLLHNSNPAFSPALIANPFSTPGQTSQLPGSGVTFVPFPSSGDGTGPCFPVASAKYNVAGVPASYDLMTPDDKATVSTNFNPSLQVNTSGSSLATTPTSVEQARQAYETITERIEQFNRELVLQSPVLDNIQQEAIAKYRLDMATERARCHKTLKALEEGMEKGASRSPGISANGNQDETDNRSKVQFRLPSSSPSRRLNVDAPVWQPSHPTKSLMSPTATPCAVINERASEELSQPVPKEEHEAPAPESEIAVQTPATETSSGRSPLDICEGGFTQNDKELPRVTGVGPLGSAGYPIPELLSAEGANTHVPQKLFVWVDESGRRTDELPLHILEYYNKEIGERIRAGKAGEKPEFMHLHKPSDYDYFMNFEPIDVVQWILTSGHFGVRKDLREELACESEDKRKKGPDICEWRDWQNVQEWDQRFDAARHHQGVDTPVWTEKHGWIVCYGEDRQPPGPNDNKWMTDYERMYWIRKPDSVFRKLKPDDPRIEYMENTCDECSRWSIDDKATVYTDDPRWLDFQAQFDRLTAAGENINRPGLRRLEEPVTWNGRKLTMEESEQFWREQLEEGKNYRDKHKMHRSLHCTKHAKVSAAKEKEIKTWIENVRAVKKFDSRIVQRGRASNSSPYSLNWGFNSQDHEDDAKQTKLLESSGNDLVDNVNNETDSPPSPSKSLKGISSVSITTEIANATTSATGQRRLNAHTALIQRLKSFNIPQGNEKDERAAAERSSNVVADVRSRFPFQGNFSRHS